MLLSSNANLHRNINRKDQQMCSNCSSTKWRMTNDAKNISNLNLSESWSVHDLEPNFNKKKTINTNILRHVRIPDVQLC